MLLLMPAVNRALSVNRATKINTEFAAFLCSDHDFYYAIMFLLAS